MNIEIVEYDDYGYVGKPLKQPFEESVEKEIDGKLLWVFEVDSLEHLISIIRKYDLLITTKVDNDRILLTFNSQDWDYRKKEF